MMFDLWLVKLQFRQFLSNQLLKRSSDSQFLGLTFWSLGGNFTKGVCKQITARFDVLKAVFER